MMTIRRFAAAACATAAVIGITGMARAATTPAVEAAATPAMRAACPPVRDGYQRCMVEVRIRQGNTTMSAAGAARSTAAPSGWGAKAIESAYKLPVARGSGQTIAVVGAFRTPHLASYLAAYRKQYGLPPCTTSSGCLRIVNQAGRVAPLPARSVDTGWDLETTLDADMVSAACPRCMILVVEARNNADTALAAAEDTAARLGAQVISNSYGSREDSFTATLAKAYDHLGHVIVASSGDIGFTAASAPANLASVTAVGGTELHRADTQRGWRETVWNNGGASGSGCSAYAPKPAWQHDKVCAMRTIADVSALAWNIAIYEKHYGGWVTVGGTSAAAPLIAGVYGLAGNASVISPGYEYRHRGSLFDIATGNNNALGTNGGTVCDHTYICVAKRGYDGPSGLGTPDGTGAF